MPDQDSDNEPNAPPSYAAATLRPPIGIQDCDGEPWERCGSDVMEIRDDRIECPIWPCTWTHFSDPENRYRNKGFPWAVQWMAWHFCDCDEEEDEVEGIVNFPPLASTERRIGFNKSRYILREVIYV